VRPSAAKRPLSNLLTRIYRRAFEACALNLLAKTCFQEESKAGDGLLGDAGKLGTSRLASICDCGSTDVLSR